jgi:hypothetical protein
VYFFKEIVDTASLFYNTNTLVATSRNFVDLVTGAFVEGKLKLLCKRTFAEMYKIEKNGILTELHMTKLKCYLNKHVHGRYRQVQVIPAEAEFNI